MKRVDLTDIEKELINDQYRSGKSGKDIAIEYNLSSKAVYRYLKEHDLTRQMGTQPYPKEIRDEVGRLYTEGHSTMDIGLKLEISQATVSNIIRELGIERTSQEGQILRLKGINNCNYIEAIKLYQDGMGVYPIAHKLNVDESVIYRWLKEEGITPRGRSESLIKYHQTHDIHGINHPNYGKPRSEETRKKISESKGGRISVKCAWCDNIIDLPRYRGDKGNHFCSTRCRSLYQSTNQKGENSHNWKGGRSIILHCTYCGNEVHRAEWEIKDRKGVFCNKSCSAKYKQIKYSGKDNPHWKGGLVTVHCSVCGAELKRAQNKINGSGVYWCNKNCESKWKHIYWGGENCPSWNGGTSFLPYCLKFNADFKARVRAFWGNKCVLCGIDESKLSRSLSIHHVHGLKKETCCDPEAPRDFVPLCDSCHGKTNTHDPVKRNEYKQYFLKLIEEKEGKCYYTKEEYTEE